MIYLLLELDMLIQVILEEAHLILFMRSHGQIVCQEDLLIHLMEKK